LKPHFYKSLVIANAVEDYEQVFYKEQEHNEKKYSENNYQRLKKIMLKIINCSYFL